MTSLRFKFNGCIQHGMMFNLRDSQMSSPQGAHLSHNPFKRPVVAFRSTGGEKISSGNAPMHSAMVFRASQTTFLACRPQECKLEGFPKISFKNGTITSKAASQSGVVAA